MATKAFQTLIVAVNLNQEGFNPENDNPITEAQCLDLDLGEYEKKVFKGPLVAANSPSEAIVWLQENGFGYLTVTGLVDGSFEELIEFEEPYLIFS